MAFELEKWMDNRSFRPFRELSRFEDTFDRFFHDLRSMKKATPTEYEFSPTCEVSEEETKYVLKFDMPGVPKDQVKVEMDKNLLTVTAERKEEKTTETKKKYLSEVFYGSYSRSFSLPANADDKKIEAKFENGVLTVTVAKMELPKAKQVTVQ